MLRLPLISVFALASLTISGLSMQAQTATQETVADIAFGEDMTLVLPVENGMADVYVIELAPLGFENADMARRFVNSLSDNMVHFTANEVGSIAEMRPQYQNLGDQEWDRNAWNAYLGKIQLRFQRNYERYLDQQ